MYPGMKAGRPLYQARILLLGGGQLEWNGVDIYVNVDVILSISDKRHLSQAISYIMIRYLSGSAVSDDGFEPFFFLLPTGAIS